MTLLAYAVALTTLPALLIALASTRYDLDARECPDVRFDEEIDVEAWAHLERSLYRLEARSHTTKKSRGYATVEDTSTGRKIARAISGATQAWFELTDDPVVLALEILRQQCDLSWDWSPASTGHYEMRLTSA